MDQFSGDCEMFGRVIPYASLRSFAACYLRRKIRSTTDPFKILELQNPSIDVSELH